MTEKADINSPIQLKIRRHKLFLIYLYTANRLIKEYGFSIAEAIRASQEIIYLSNGLNSYQAAIEIKDQSSFFLQLNN